MASIRTAGAQDVGLLAWIGSLSFVESHGHSASQEVIDGYIAEKFNETVLAKELDDPENIYHIIFHEDLPVGYSKIVLSSSHPKILAANVTKLERLYLLKNVYGLQLGSELFEWNLNISKNAGQAGMWLYTWKENTKAINFYQKKGFAVIGSYDFALSASHSNPNHLMYLRY